MTIELRPYQRDAVAAIHVELGRVRSTLVSMATGCGKTTIFADVARERRCLGRVLVVAHRDELISQAAQRIREQTGLSVEIEKADSWVDVGGGLFGSRDVVVASVQSLRGTRLRRFPRNFFLTVVVDEAHHSTAASYREIVDHFETASILGVTATPDRGDGVAMAHVFESVAYEYGIREAIRDGWLAPIVQKRIVCEHLDLSRVRKSGDDLNEADLAAALSLDAVLHEIAAPLVREAGARPTIVFTASVSQAHALVAVLAGYGVTAEAIDGTTDASRRQAVLAAYARGDVQYVVNCAVLTEGFDAPRTACVAVARPTRSRALYAQMLGRGTRLAPGKTDVLCIDFAGNAGTHSLVGPLDILAGRELPEAMKQAAEKARGEDGYTADVLAALEAEERAESERRAAEDERRRKAKVRAEARYAAEVVDPFGGGYQGAFWPEELEQAGVVQRDARAQSARTEAASDKQVAFLRRLGVDGSGMTKREASAAIGQRLQGRQRSERAA